MPMYGQYPYANPYQNPYMNQQFAGQMPTTPKYKGTAVYVNGRNGAEAFQMEPNSSVLLLDETAPILWVKNTDGAGYPTLTPYSLSPYQPEQPVDVKNLEMRISRIEEALGVSQSSNSAADQTKPANGTN